MISKLLCTDVLAIRHIQDFILVGIGYTLHIFKNDTFELMKKMIPLYPHNIHGIVPGPENKLAIFGTSSIRIYDALQETGELILKENNSVNGITDWILAVEWFIIKGEIHLCILCAHNCVKIYNISNESHKSIWCEEKCILYGGSIYVQNNESLIILSGTVFQEILIWEINFDCDHSTDVSILHRLTDHNGVIFSVIYDSKKQLICSTSDDRTVRLWKVTCSSLTERYNTNWKDADIKLVRTMFGHSARVWRAVIQDNVLITIGEDSLICTWSLEGQLLNKVNAHQGAPIWSIEILTDGNILTGGADGAVNLWNFSENYLKRNITCLDDDSTLKSICYLNTGTILIFTENGQLVAYNANQYCPREILFLEKYSTYCVVQVSNCRSYIAFASRNGDIAIYKEVLIGGDRKLHQILEEKVMSTKVFSLHWLTNNTILACELNGILNIFSFTDEGEIKLQSTYLLPQSKERWLTAATIFKELLICGDRAGHMHVYRLNNLMPDDCTLKASNFKHAPVQTLLKVHGRIGTQAFIVRGEKLISAGRDGTLQFYEVSDIECKKELRSLHRKKMPMDWIGNMMKLDNDILVLGFKEVEFIIYSMLHHRILGRIACGGGHRSWDCITSNRLLKFAFIRNKHAFECEYCLHIIKQPVLLNGFHPKHVYCVRAIESVMKQSIVVSGGEDGTLRITAIVNESKTTSCSFRTLSIICGHISSIKAIATIKLNSDSFVRKYIVFSAGGRAQLKVWEINLNSNRNIEGGIDISSCDTASHMLHGSDKLRKKPWQNADQSYILEPETRYMDIAVYLHFKYQSCILVFVACADGCLRIFSYEIDKRTIDLRICAKYVNRCILKVHTLRFNEKLLVLTMSTDGAIRVFDFTSTIDTVLSEEFTFNSQKCLDVSDPPFAELRVHQCGINSFDLKETNKGEYLLVTGGDDNLISLLHFKIFYEENDKNKLALVLLSQWNTSSAHLTQITGVQFSDKNTICSVGMDQRLIMYKYLHTDSDLCVQLTREAYTSIADIQGLLLLSPESEANPLAYVYGKGFEILEI